MRHSPQFCDTVHLMMKLIKQLRFKHVIVFAVMSFIIWGGVVGWLLMSINTVGQEDLAQSADTIIVLGSGLRRDGRPGDALFRRSVWASMVYERGLADTIICTGGVGEGKPRSEADACREVLESRGVPADVILLEEQSTSTEENAIYARQLMEENSFEDAILVTDSFHMLRANWIFNSYDIRHYRSAVPRDWVRDYFYTRHTTREIVALHWHLFKEALNLPVTSV